MPLTVVIGGQYGSEGKGKIACHLAKALDAVYAVRCGGTNSGHTVIDAKGEKRIFRCLPTAAVVPRVKLAICAGSYIEPEVLLKEIDQMGLGPDRLLIDRNAMIISRDMKIEEEACDLPKKIGSTGSGVGAAVARRIARDGSVNFAGEMKFLKPFVGDVSATLRASLKHGERTIIEGTQGFGLSLLHSDYYPKVTSRDTTAASFVSEAGLSPLDVDDIALVIRAFPIRVGGDSGPLPYEIDWETVTREGCHQTPIIEYTSVTGKVRRVGRFDADVVQRAITINNPTKIFLNHVDYFANKIDSKAAKMQVRNIEKLLNYEIYAYGTSPQAVVRT